MQAVKRFDPDRGFRLATYAMWWIRAAIQEYILHSWSLVKMGTTAARKKLSFNLRKLKGQMQAINEGDLAPETVQAIAERLDVTETEVIEMNRRLEGGDRSLNVPFRVDSNTEWRTGWWMRRRAGDNARGRDGSTTGGRCCIGRCPCSTSASGTSDRAPPQGRADHAGGAERRIRISRERVRRSRCGHSRSCSGRSRRSRPNRWRTTWPLCRRLRTWAGNRTPEGYLRRR